MCICLFVLHSCVDDWAHMCICLFALHSCVDHLAHMCICLYPYLCLSSCLNSVYLHASFLNCRDTANICFTAAKQNFLILTKSCSLAWCSPLSSDSSDFRLTLSFVRSNCCCSTAHIFSTYVHTCKYISARKHAQSTYTYISGAHLDREVVSPFPNEKLKFPVELRLSRGNHY